MNGPHAPADIITQVEGWIDDLAAHEQATEHIMALGPAALEPLLHYLQRGPQLVSQPREFAVRMLARLHDPRVPEKLRNLLHEHPLHGLPAALAESEYRVKDAVVEAMAYLQACATEEDIAFAVLSERLPAAVRGAGVLHLTAMAHALAGLLTDDVLAARAAVALSALQPESVAAVIENLRVWLDPKTDSTRTRLGLVRGFAWLAMISATVESALSARGLEHPCALVRAAAALSMRDAGTRPAIAALVHGVLGTDTLLALSCRSRLQGRREQLFDPALKALCANSEPDIYGDHHPAEAGARDWLLTQLLQQTVLDTEHFQKVAAGVPADELVACLSRWRTPRIETLRYAMRHNDARVRIASVIALGRIDADGKAGCLAILLGDIDHAVRHRAHRALRRFLAMQQGRIGLGDVPRSAWWRSPRRCIQLLALSRWMQR